MCARVRFFPHELVLSDGKIPRLSRTKFGRPGGVDASLDAIDSSEQAIPLQTHGLGEAWGDRRNPPPVARSQEKKRVQ